MIRLTRCYDKSGFACPHCGEMLEVDDWNNDGCGPQPGTGYAHCPLCYRRFNFEASIEVHITAWNPN